MDTTTAHTEMIGQEQVTAVTRETTNFVVTAWVTAAGETLHEDWALKP